MNFTVDWSASLLVGGVAFAIFLLGGLVAGLVSRLVRPQNRPTDDQTEKK